MECEWLHWLNFGETSVIEMGETCASDARHRRKLSLRWTVSLWSMINESWIKPPWYVVKRSDDSAGRKKEKFKEKFLKKIQKIYCVKIYWRIIVIAISSCSQYFCDSILLLWDPLARCKFGAILNLQNLVLRGNNL